MSMLREQDVLDSYFKNSYRSAVKVGDHLPSDSAEAMRRHTLVLIPARDEDADVGEVVTQVRQLGLQVLVIDDHSDDNTADVARYHGAQVLRLSFHCGCWAALQAGMRYALASGFHYVLTMDADGQHLAQEIPKMLQAAVHRQHKPNVVVGSCTGRANRRRHLAWHMLRWLSGLNIRDLTSGFRFYDHQALRLLARPHCSLIEYQDVAVLLYLRRHRLVITEIPVRMRGRCHGHSRIFSSWPMVIYYLIYSALISGTRRSKRRGKPTPVARIAGQD
ncbi:MAG: glycosyltransferase family 2 protein [Gammaproteobacteria bacterium]|jgi:glycosyltransferase involved in cell wall biosynthesis|nr:glycosyltransferase family 2 protein [Gammaproteobacteria bacterium]